LEDARNRDNSEQEEDQEEGQEQATVMRRLVEENRMLRLSLQRLEDERRGIRMVPNSKRQPLKPIMSDEIKAAMTRAFSKGKIREELRVKTLGYKYRLPNAFQVRMATKLNPRRKWLLTHVRYRKQEACERYNKMYKWGSRFGLNVSKTLTRIKNVFKDPGTEITICEKYNGVYFCAFAIKKEKDGRVYLDVISIQGKKGAWRRDDHWWNTIMRAVRKLQLDYDAGLFGEESKFFIVAGEILGQTRGQSATEHWRSVTVSVRRRENITLKIFDITIYDQDEVKYYRYTPEQVHNILEFWRGIEANKDSIAEMILITKEDYDLYTKDKLLSATLGLNLCMTSEDPLRAKLVIHRAVLPHLRLSDQAVEVLKSLEGRMNFTNGEIQALSYLVQQKKFPNPEYAFCMYQILMRMPETLKLSTKEKHVMDELSDMRGFSERFMAKNRHENRSEKTRKAVENIRRAVDLVSDLQRGNKEGAVMCVKKGDGSILYCKSKRSYEVRKSTFHKCLLLHQKHGIVIGFNPSKRIFKKYKNEVTNYLPDEILVYLSKRINRNTYSMEVMCRVKLDWKETCEEEREEWDYESLICDSSGISSEAAKRFLYFFYLKTFFQRIFFFHKTDLGDKICHKIDRNPGGYSFFTSKRSKPMDYVLIYESDYAWAVSASQVLMSYNNIFLDGYFIRYFVHTQPLLPPGIMGCKLLKIHDELPIAVKLFLGQPVPFVPEFMFDIQSHELIGIFERHGYSEYSDLYSAVQGGLVDGVPPLPIQYIHMGTCAALLKIQTAAWKRYAQFLKSPLNTLPFRLNSFSGLPDVPFEELTALVMEIYGQHLADRAYLMAFQGEECKDGMACDSYASTNLGLEFHIRKSGESRAYSMHYKKSSVDIQKEYMEYLMGGGDLHPAKRPRVVDSITEPLSSTAIRVPSSYYGRSPGIRPLDCPLDFTTKAWRADHDFSPDYKVCTIRSLAYHWCFVEADNLKGIYFHDYWEMMSFYVERFKLYNRLTNKVIDEPLDMPGSLGLLTEYLHDYDPRDYTSVLKTRHDTVQKPSSDSIEDKRFQRHREDDKQPEEDEDNDRANPKSTSSDEADEDPLNESILDEIIESNLRRYQEEDQQLEEDENSP